MRSLLNEPENVSAVSDEVFHWLFFSIWVLKPVKIILLTLSRVNRKIEKHLNTCKQAYMGLSHMWPELGLNTQLWDDERFRTLNITVLNYSATGAAVFL